MALENPGSLVWAALAAVVAGFYLWRSRGISREVATFHLWQRALARRPAWVALRFWLSLTALVAALLLMVVALAQPYRTGRAIRGRSLVLILDTSAGMSAADVPPSRLDAMRQQAAETIDGLRRGDRMGILAAGRTVRTLARLGESPAALRAACEAIAPAGGSPQIAEAVRVARLMLQDQPNPRIIVLTGGAFPGAEQWADQPDIRVIVSAAAPRNAAITRLAARPLESDPNRFAVLVEVTNNGALPVSAPLEIAIDNGDSRIVHLDLEPGDRVREVFTVESDQPAQLEAVLRIEDDVLADNRALLPLERRPPVKVRLVAEPSEVRPALEAALASIPGVALEVVSTLPRFDQADETAAPESAARAIHVFHGLVPSQMPPGSIVLAPRDGGDLWERVSAAGGPVAEVAAVVAPPVGTGAPDGTGVNPAFAPLLAGVHVADVVIERAVQLEFLVPAEPVVLSEAGQPLYSRLQHPERPVLVWHGALEREHGDLILRRDFPRLLRNAVEHVAGPAAATVSAQLPDVAETLVPAEIAGQPLPADPGPGTPLWMLLAGAASLLLAVEGCLFHRRLTV